MVINKEMKRKRKEECPSPLLDESPKRTKVHAQRKFAQGSNVNSPVITPVKEIEKQEIDVLSEPVELLPIKRPNTEDFLTFLCFRGTPVLPPSLNFFNTASIVDTNGQVHEIKSESPKNGPIDTSSISKSGSGSSERPFVAFGVRKRADPIVISRQMDKKRRHALALQALRRKYQEQKMAKIRAVAISKLSEKVTSKTLVRSNSVTKQETAKKNAPIQKGKVTVEEKEVKVETRSMSAGLRSKIKQKMCLRSFQGRFVQKELQFRNAKKQSLAVKKVVAVKEKREKDEKEKVKSEVSEDSSDDEPLAKTSTEKRASLKVIAPKIAKKAAPGPKKPIEINFRITRSNKFVHNKIVSRRQQIKQRMILTTPKTIVKPRTLRSHTAQKSRILSETKQTILVKSKTLIQTKEIKKQQLPVIKKTLKTNTKIERKETGKKEKQTMLKKETRLSEILKKTPKSVESGKGEISSPALPTKKNEKPIIKKEPENTKKVKVENKQIPQLNKTQTVKETEKNKKKMFAPSKKIEKKEHIKKEAVKQEENIKPAKHEENKKLTKQEDNKKLTKQEDSKKPIKQEEPKKITKQEETKKIATKTEQKELAESKNLRPTRKTKEAAAIYMEILSHKLVNEGKIDDDNVSIDSFPELPNVKRTEQRENELKAKAKTKPEDLKVRKEEVSENKVLRSAEKRKPLEEKKKEIESEDKPKRIEEKKSAEVIKEDICDRKTRSQQDKTIIEKVEEKGNDEIKKVTTIRKKGYDLIIEEFNSASEEEEEEEIKEDKKEESLKRQTRNSTQNIRHTESDDSDESFRADIKIPRKKQITRSKITKNCDSDESIKKSLRTNARSYKESSDSDESTTSDVNLSQQTQKKNKKFTKTRQVKEEHSFSDSDEEPLSKLTQNKKKETKEEIRKPQKEADEEKQVKPKRECAKRPQNYLPMFSSSDEEDEFFHGFNIEAPKPKPKIQENLCSHPQTSDLSCKDIGRRFGKGKVNMSTEQIEKWLKDSAMAGGNIKSEDDNVLNFGENIPTETWFSVANSIDTDKLKSVLISQSEKQDDKKEGKVSEAESPSPSRPSSATKSADRKLIFRNKDKGVVSNVKAFSVSNENSVYAFEESEDTMKTPFRRPTRRPSSTATSRSEDEAKVEDLPKTQFRKPPLVRQDSLKSKEEDDSAFYIPSTLNKSKSFPSMSKIDKKMVPPKVTKSSHKKSEAIEEKYKVPSSPSASSSSSAKLYKRQTKFRATEMLPVKVSDFPIGGAQLVEAPTFHPTDKEFQDPLEYIEKIRAKAEQFGICRIVPPSTFKPECKVTDDMRFTAYNQYVHKMLHRWGPNFKELMAIKKYLSTQNINLTHPPWIGGMEVDLPRLYQTVQSLGGLKEVIEKKKWPKVSDAMKIPKSAQDRVTKLDDIYCKYLLPYDTLSPAEREKLFDEVETEWAKRESKSLLKAQQSVETNESDEEETDDEAEECIVKGRSMALNAFYRIARNTMSMWFKTSEPLPEEVEQEFWKHVTLKQNHICVHSGSIDSGNWGYGFAVSKNSPFARHAWNLKVLTNNSGSVLRSLGPIMGVTVPTLHVGMVFSSCCWYRDPHSLPWIEYLHTGGSKIWYGIPNSTSGAFQAALKTMVPNYCRNKSLWLPSDTVMVPPNLLVEHGVALSRIVQEPGQFIVVFPKVFTSSLSTGYVVSESVYFAPPYWLKSGRVVFDELRNSCEPSMFSFDRLLLSILNDVRSNVEVLKQIIPAIQQLCDKEKSARAKIKSLGVNNTEKLPPPEAPQRKKRKLQNEDGEYECEICRMNLFVSMVTESQEDSVLCLEHAVEQIEKKKIQSKHCTLAYTYDDDELNGLIEKIKEAIANKLQKKVPGRFAGLPTLLTN